MQLSGKTFLITGASSGIGAATALAAAQEKAKLVLVARSENNLAAVAAQVIKAGGSASTYAADLSNLDAARQVAARIEADAGTPDIVMNNAGSGQWKPIVETDASEAVAMMAAPYFAAFAMTRAFLPGFFTRGSGLFINVTSIGAFMAWPGAGSYIAARWAMRGFHEALAADLRGTGINAMLVAFAKVESHYWTNNPGSEQNIPDRQSMIPVLTVKQAADHIIAGIRRDATEVFEPRQLRFVLRLARWFPGQVK